MPGRRSKSSRSPRSSPIRLGVLASGRGSNFAALADAPADGRLGGGSTDILVTDAYRWAFERGEQYGMAAALGTIIFLLLLGWSFIGRGLTKGDEEARP